MRYLCQDEMRLGLKSETGRVITSIGVKPVAPVQWKRDHFWMYGVVKPPRGWQFSQEYPHLNSEHFQSFLDALKRYFRKNKACPKLCPKILPAFIASLVRLIFHSIRQKGWQYFSDSCNPQGGVCKFALIRYLLIRESANFRILGLTH